MQVATDDKSLQSRRWMGFDAIFGTSHREDGDRCFTQEREREREELEAP